MHKTQLYITMETTHTMETTNVTKLSAKYEKFVVFSYWLSEQMKNSENNTATIMEFIHGAVPEQNEFMNSFFEDYKIINKNYKKEMRERAKAAKPPPPPKEPQEQKKRGRKKKEIVDTRSEEERLMDEIIANAQV